MEANGQPHTSATLPLGTEPLVPIGQEAGRAPEPVGTLWRKQKSLASVRIEPQLSSPQPSRYTNRAVPAPLQTHTKFLHSSEEVFLLINGAPVGLYSWSEFKYPTLKVLR